MGCVRTVVELLEDGTGAFGVPFGFVHPTDVAQGLGTPTVLQGVTSPTEATAQQVQIRQSGGWLSGAVPSLLNKLEAHASGLVGLLGVQEVEDALSNDTPSIGQGVALEGVGGGDKYFLCVRALGQSAK